MEKGGLLLSDINMEHEIQPKKIFIARKAIKKERSDKDFDEKKFISKVAKGATSADAAVIAGYKGNTPDLYGARVRSQPRVRKTLQEIFDKKARIALRRITAKTTRNASLSQLAMSAGIMARNAREEKVVDQPQKHLHLHLDITKLSNDQLQEYLAEKSRALADDRERS